MFFETANDIDLGLKLGCCNPENRWRVGEQVIDMMKAYPLFSM